VNILHKKAAELEEGEEAKIVLIVFILIKQTVIRRHCYRHQQHIEA
jgi:hypothetical protein